MMLVPIGHENMAARRWPVVTLSLIAINTIVFLATLPSMQTDQKQAGHVKAEILILAALHPELKMHPEEQQMVDGFKKSDPEVWKQIQNPYRDIINPYEARIKLMEDPAQLQGEMDSLNDEWVKVSATSTTEQYAFVPAHPAALSYITANFLHGGWMHLIGNMWFLWLAGFVLEDVWGRWLYSAFYLIAGAAALQFHAWLNPGSITPTLGTSGAVAALMGAFLVRFPKMKIEMAWLLMFRLRRFQAPAYCLLPLWLLGELFYGSLLGSHSSVAHWAHVGGFVFGAVAALAIQHSGLEHQANQAIEQKVAWTTDAEIGRANDMIEQGQLDEAKGLLESYVANHPNSLDGWSLLRQIYTRQGDTKSYLEVTVKTCALHLKAHQVEAAFQDYAEFLDNGGGRIPAGTWLDLCKGAEAMQEFERALQEYEYLARAYPAERHFLTAQLSAARLCLKKLNRPQDALRIYQAAAASPVPHLDWEQLIRSGIKEAKAAVGGGSAVAARV